MLLIGSRQRALATILHEASHGSFTKNKNLSKILGTYFSGYLIFQSWSSYKQSHIKNHHSKLGSDLDPDYTFYCKMGVFEKYNKKELSIIFIVHLSIIFLLFHFDHTEYYFVYWLLPYLTIFRSITWFIELSEHYPMIKDAKTNLHASRNRFSYWLEALFMSMHNENYHLIHHLFPKIPFWRLQEAHNILLKDVEYRQINEQFGGIFFSNNLKDSMWRKLCRSTQ